MSQGSADRCRPLRARPPGCGSTHLTPIPPKPTACTRRLNLRRRYCHTQGPEAEGRGDTSRSDCSRTSDLRQHGTVLRLGRCRALRQGAAGAFGATIVLLLHTQPISYVASVAAETTLSGAHLGRLGSRVLRRPPGRSASRRRMCVRYDARADRLCGFDLHSVTRSYLSDPSIVKRQPAAQKPPSTFRLVSTAGPGIGVAFAVRCSTIAMGELRPTSDGWSSARLRRGCSVGVERVRRER